MSNLVYMLIGWLILFVLIQGPELIFRVIFRCKIKDRKNRKA